MSASRPRLCVTIPCKGRLTHLRQAIPTWLAQRVTAFEWDILVIDDACPDDTVGWCRQQGQAKLRCCRFEPAGGQFSLSRARNLGAKWSEADAVLWVDADLLAPPDLLERLGRALFDGEADLVHGVVCGEPLSDGTGERYTFPRSAADCHAANSISVMRLARREIWEQVRGFDESFSGWGWEDVDFRERILRHCGEHRERFVPADGLIFLNHSADDSVRFYTEKDKRLSAAQNYALLQQRDRVVNPHGFGSGEPVERVDFRAASLHGEWMRYYSAAGAPVPYGTDQTYRLAADWLGGLATVEDWGCGYAYARRYFAPPTTYLGIDWHGSPAGLADITGDLHEYRSQPAGILLRHVLEHNPDWRRIAANFFASFQRRGFLACFIPPAAEAATISVEPTLDIPALQISEAELEGLIPADVSWTKELLPTGSAPFGVEVVYRFERVCATKKVI